jgi:hypothetical protein
MLAFLQSLPIAVVMIVLHEQAGRGERSRIRHPLQPELLRAVGRAVRQDILKGKTEGLELFVHFNFDSPMSAIKMLGWTLFSILSALAVVSLFKGGRVDK